jgi:hypothetical protein
VVKPMAESAKKGAFQDPNETVRVGKDANLGTLDGKDREGLQNTEKVLGGTDHDSGDGCRAKCGQLSFRMGLKEVTKRRAIAKRNLC